MKILNVKEINDENEYCKFMTLDEYIHIESFIKIIKQFESDQVQMIECVCDTYNDDGESVRYWCSTIEQMEKVVEKSSNPSIYFEARFGLKNTLDYAFTLSTTINTRELVYFVDKKKLNNHSKINSL